MLLRDAYFGKALTHRWLFVGNALLWLLLGSAAHADFTDELPASPQPTATKAAPKEGNQTPASTLPEKHPNAPTPAKSQPTPQNTTPAKTPAAPEKAKTTPAAVPAPAHTATPPAKEKDFLTGNFFGEVKHDTNAPISISAEKVEGSRERGQAVISGNVVVIQSDLKLTSDVMEIFAKAGGTTPERIISKGNPRAEKKVAPNSNEIIEATADEMEFRVSEGKLILKKRAKITRGKDCQIQGDIIEYAMKAGDVSVKGMRGACIPMMSSTPAPK